jgi:hypothetical protein
VAASQSVPTALEKQSQQKVFFIADLFRPVNDFAAELFPYGDARHGGGRFGSSLASCLADAKTVSK